MQGVAFELEFAALPPPPLEATVDQGDQQQRQATCKRERGDEGDALAIALAGRFALREQRGFAIRHRFGKRAHGLARLRNQRDDFRVGDLCTVRAIVAEDAFELRAARSDRGGQLLRRGDLRGIVRDPFRELRRVVFHRRDVAPVLLEGDVAAGQTVIARIHFGKLEMTGQGQDLLAHLIGVQGPLVRIPVQPSGHEHRCRERQDEDYGQRGHRQHAAAQAGLALKGFHLRGRSLFHRRLHTGEWLHGGMIRAGCRARSCFCVSDFAGAPFRAQAGVRAGGGGILFVPFPHQNRTDMNALHAPAGGDEVAAIAAAVRGKVEPAD
ncbi:MAG TPA: hypothetical protein VHD89_01495, partial [Rhodanobacteraceae bacterium]|nr:hypothetical protein [Rhodanobacteraceae bacterium]